MSPVLFGPAIGVGTHTWWGQDDVNVLSFPTDGHFWAVAVEVDCWGFSSRLLEPRKPPIWRKVFSRVFISVSATQRLRGSIDTYQHFCFMSGLFAHFAVME